MRTRRKQSAANAATGLLGTLAGVLFAEALIILADVVAAVVALLRDPSSSGVDGVAWLVTAAIGVLWTGGAGLGALRRQSWIRGAVITWQLVQLAVALGCLEGLVGTWWLGIVLLVLGIGGFVLVVLPPVSAALARRPGERGGSDGQA